MFKTLLRFIFVVISLLVVSAQPAHAAAPNFTTDYHVTYKIGEDGIAHAVVNATLTNVSSDVYASSYRMQLGFDNINNVMASDSRGAIQPTVTKMQDGYLIDVTFNNKAVGLDSKQQFMITFDTPTLARNFGNAWEISIPGISNPAEFKSFIVELQVPPSFGKPAYIKPPQPTDTLIFTKESLGSSGISLSFGEKQVYDFALTYHLRNTNLYPITTEIALPPETNYQQVAITNIDPTPKNVIEDKDGNWLAQYKLNPAQKQNVVVRGKAEVNLKPKEVGLTPEERQAFTKPDKFWEASSDQIREKADELRTPEAIYAYVVSTLSYDFTRVTDKKQRLGAVGALQNQKSAVCREFTDLFIALARAVGIPAREVDGYAYTENPKLQPLSKEQDILHVWPEYYDDQKKTWVMVDPTWGKTTGGIDYFNKLDFAHLAFAIKGFDSSYPIPAGGYKFPGEEATKDVQVQFTKEKFQSTSSYETQSSIPSTAIGGFPISGKVKILNTGSSYLPPQVIYLTSTTFSPKQQALASKGIPPFGYAELEAGYDATSFLTKTEGNYTIQVAGATDVKRVTVAPFFMSPLGGGIIIGIFTFIILIFAVKSRRLHLFR